MGDSSPPDPRFRAPRRVATAPVSMAESSRAESPDPAASPLAEALVETLYSHPNIKIISFTATGRAFNRSTGLPGEDAPGSLSWSSQLERTIAVGPFRIYRAPGSVAFLSCGSALQPILRKSQCWCIDEINSKFVLQIRRPNYWRIELPVDDPEDQKRAEELREVLDKILQFEKTECPFKRTFTVELPPQTPVILRPWQARSIPSSPAIEEDSSPISPPSATRRASFAERTSTPTRLRRHHEVEESDDEESDEEDSFARHNHPSVPMEVASLELRTERARLEAEALERLKRENDGHWSYENAVPDQGPLAEPGRDRGTNDEYFGSNGDDVYYSHEPQHETTQGSVSRPSLTSRPRPSSFPAIPEHQASAGGSSSKGDAPAYELHEGSGSSRGKMKTRLRRSRFAVARSATLPPHLKLSMDRSSDSSGESKARRTTSLEPFPEVEDEAEASRLRRRGSDDSFHSVESWQSESATDTHTTEPNEDAAAKDEADDDDESDDESSETDSDEDSESTDDEPPLKMAGAFPVTTGAEAQQEAPQPTMRRRPTVTSHGTTSSISVARPALSQLPSAANLFASLQTERRPMKSRLEAVRNIPTSIITKALEMLLGPPAYLITLMLRVARKIVDGQWRGLVFGYNDDGEEIPVRWDYSEGDFSDWSDDEPCTSHPGRRHHHRTRGSKDEGAATEGCETSSESSRSSRNWAGVD